MWRLSAHGIEPPDKRTCKVILENLRAEAVMAFRFDYDREPAPTSAFPCTVDELPTGSYDLLLTDPTGEKTFLTMIKFPTMLLLDGEIIARWQRPHEMETTQGVEE
jgi:hypothetical protein